MKQFTPKRCRADLFKWLPQWNSIPIYASWLLIALFLSFVNVNLNAQAIDLDKILADDGVSHDYFGYSVSISGDQLVVGAHLDDDNGSNSGSVYVYEKQGGVWTYKQKLTAFDGAADDRFGNSVSISGDYLVVGSYYDDDNGIFDSGSAYVYEKQGGVWTYKQKLTAFDGAANDRFGNSVSISGDQLVVGVNFDDDNGDFSGSVYVYEKQGGVWTYKQKLTAFDGAAFDNFGHSVSISGDQLVVGAFGDDDNGSNSGSVYVYEKQGGVWTYKQKLTAFDGAADDRFGNSVSISGDQLVVGANFDDDNGSYSGSVYVYEKQGGVWTYKQKLTAFDGAAFDNFGHSVSISGDQLVVGAFGDDDNGSNSGSVYVYKKQGGVWTYKQKLTAFDGAAFDNFGHSVSISGDQLVVGAYLKNDNGNLYSGSAYVASLAATCTLSLSCPADQTVNTDAGVCEATLNFTDPVMTSSDAAACNPVLTQTAGPSAGTQAAVGPHTLSFEATDDDGNIATCSFTITVEDNEDPMLMCEDIVVELDANGEVSITADQFVVSATDNCTVVTPFFVGNPVKDFTCADVGQSYTRKIRVKDPSDNKKTCEKTVTIEDNIAPDAQCQPFTVQLDAAGNGTLAAADIDNNSADACGIKSLSIDAAYENWECSDIGPHTVTLTVTDNNDNISTCDATVTVDDDIQPTLECEDITVQLAADGTYTLVATESVISYDDNCTITKTPFFPKSSGMDQDTIFDCSDVGNTYELKNRVKDQSNNAKSCIFDVTIEDNVLPDAQCKPFTVQLDATGNGILAADDIDNISADACGIKSLSIESADEEWECSDIGSHTVTLTVTDNNDNISTCDATVTVDDDIQPTLECEDITVQLAADGTYTLVATESVISYDDNCTITKTPFFPKSSGMDQDTIFDCSDVGNTYELKNRVKDQSNNAKSCIFDVTIEDNVLPNAQCKPFTVLLDGFGNGTLAASEIDNNSADACGIKSLSIDAAYENWECSDIGPHTVTLTVTDNNDNVSTCDADVTVVDDISPVIMCQNVIAELDANGEVSITADQFVVSASDNCTLGSPFFRDNPVTDFTCADANQTYNLSIRVKDQSNNNDTCGKTVTIVDNVAPVAQCQNVIVQLDAAGNGSTTATAVDNGSNDACGIATLELSKTDFDCSNVGPNPVTLTVTDVNNNVSDCPAVVTVEDNVAAEALCQNVTVQLDAAGNGSTTATAVDNGSNDACGIALLELSTTAFDCSNVGPNPVTLTVTDVNNNVSDCPAVVTVEDNVAAEALCQNVTVQLDAAGNGSTTATAVDNGSNDACGIALLELSTTAFDCSNVGPNPVTLTVTDVNNNVSDCPAVVTVEDNVAAEALCQNVTVQLDAAGNGSTTATAVDNGSNDACGIATLELSKTDFDCSNVGPNPVTLTVTDVNNNVSDCPAVVTVEDNVAAEALCQNVTVQLDAAGNGSTTATAVDNGSNDACGIALLELSKTAFDCSNVGPNPVTLTVTDVNNNVSDCPAVVTVEDNVAAEALCQNVTVQLDAAGNGSTTATAVDNGSNDACGIATLELSKTDFDCSNVGPNPVTLTVTDVNNNVSDCPAVVTVEDNVAAEALCQNVTVQLDAAGNGSTTATAVDNGSNDACGIATLELSKTDFDCSNVGPNPVTLTVTDVNNNVSDCPAVVTVEDNVAAEALCQNVTVQLDAAGNGSTTAAVVDNGSDDACGIATLELSKTAFDCSNVGPNPVTLTVTDVNNNVSTCDATVTVEDNVAAEALCQDVTVQLDAAGNGSTTAAAVDNGSNDACGINLLELSKTAFDCSNVGPNPVTLTVTDVNNNVSTCDAVVTVEDNLAPIMTCPDVTINLDPGFCGANVTYEVTATDNCGVASNVLVSGPASGDYLDYHDSSWDVVWEAIDVNGNATQCAFTIEIFEYANPTPVLTCNDNLQISIDPQGSGILGADMILEGGPYGCYDDYIVTIDGASNELDCSMIGEGSIMVMVEDPDTGNTCWGSIIVEDKIGPDCVTVSDYTVDCEEGLPADTDPVYWPTFGDNCAVAEVNLVSETVLNSDICTDITVERVWTAVDASGNTANTNCVQTITITRGSILLPTDIDFDCTNYTLEDLVPALTGFPEGGATSCGYSYTYTDAVFDGCGNTAAITRTWSILDECSSAVTTHVQLISLIDIQGPSITYNDITVSANVTVAHPQPCLSTAIIPTNAAVSDCSDVVSVRYFTSVGEVINGSIPAPGLPIGEHTLTITAEDACGNTSSEDFTITVIDGIAPTPVCKEITQISLSTDGTAVVPAESFDNGSYDNCCLDYIEVRRMDETTYGPTVSFDCTDETVEVVLRAVDCYENDNTCMVVALVEDKLAPTCTAPADVTGVDCDVYYSELAAALANEDYSVLEVYGQGTTADNCTLVSDYTVSYDVDECGNGTITRTWTANDAAENQTAVCKQDIFIVHNSNWTVAFSAVDQVEVECADAEIEELAPVITNDACEMIATSYTDTPFEVVGSDHCMKIFRDWTVINWCAYDGDAGNEVAFPENDVTPLTGDITGNGYATYTQVIKVVDNTAPEVTTNDALVVSEDAEACTTDIAVADVEALFGLDSNCGDVEDYHNFGDLEPYLNDAGTTFEGVPAGTYEVSRTSVDACGNTGTAVNTVTVEPKAPTAYCTDELVIDLMVTGMAEVNAADFNFASSDNCTATGDLSYAFSSDITNTVMTVTCDNLGDNIVEMWVFDADGMTDYCVVTLTVQNNNGANCGTTGTLTVAGAINTEDADAVAEVEVEVNGGLFATTTDADGLFKFDLAQGGDYTVVPSYDVNVSNGVTTFDIVKITRHILGIENLDSAYKVIAADANNSASVTTLDIVSIRKVILQIEDTFPNNTSWRFVDAAYTFADPMNPWGFAEVVNLNNLEADALSTDFVAVKVGDVTGDAQTSFGSAVDRTKHGAFAIDAKEVAMTAGNTYEVTFTADAAVEGFQFTMNFDAKKVAFVGLTERVATAENFGFAKLNEGAITASWNADAAYNFAGAEVFTVSFTALEDVNLSEAVSINSRFTAAEAYAAGELQDVALTFSGSTTANYALYQNTPNPFKGETVIAFELAEAGNAVLTIMDVNGKVVRTINGDFAKGFNNVTVKDINTTGVLYYTLESGDFTATKKMIIIE